MRLVSQKEQIGTWDDIARIMNDLTGNNYGESCYRKKSTAFQKMYDANLDVLTDVDSYTDAIMDQKRELEKAKIQFRDERNAWNKQNYLDARVSKDLDYLGEQISKMGRVNFNVKHSSISANSDNDLIICLSDLHIGETFDSSFGKYDSDIAKDRLNQYLNEVIKIATRHNSENAYIVCLGDQVSGNIHLSIQVSNRENLIDQIKLSSEYIASFCVELSQYFKNVYVSGIAGNHSRLVSDKNKDIKDERLDTLITWIVDQITKHIDNIHVSSDNIDSGIACVNVRGKDYVQVHGDNDALSDSGISKLVMALGQFPYAILGGHRHTPAYREFNNVKYIQSASLAGSGDDFTVSKRLAGCANQTVLVCTKDGIDCIYNIDLK